MATPWNNRVISFLFFFSYLKYQKFRGCETWISYFRSMKITTGNKATRREAEIIVAKGNYSYFSANILLQSSWLQWHVKYDLSKKAQTLYLCSVRADHGGPWTLRREAPIPSPKQTLYRSLKDHSELLRRNCRSQSPNKNQSYPPSQVGKECCRDISNAAIWSITLPNVPVMPWFNYLGPHASYNHLPLATMLASVCASVRNAGPVEARGEETFSGLWPQVFFPLLKWSWSWCG